VDEAALKEVEEMRIVNLESIKDQLEGYRERKADELRKSELAALHEPTEAFRESLRKLQRYFRHVPHLAGEGPATP
jgi:hypothetical protein